MFGWLGTNVQQSGDRSHEEIWIKLVSWRS